MAADSVALKTDFQLSVWRRMDCLGRHLLYRMRQARAPRDRGGHRAGGDVLDGNRDGDWREVRSGGP
eukprot:3940919-Rhodomonas_salina.2